jgi:hypothetical protein
MRVPDQIKAQEKKIHELLARADRIARTRDYFIGLQQDYVFIGEVFFGQGDTTAQDVVFQIPEDAAFVAKRMNVYPAFKFTTTDEATFGPPEISYRPCVFTSQQQALTPEVQSDNAAIDCFLSLSETYASKGKSHTRNLQNMPVPVQLFYSDALNWKPVQGAASVNLKYESFEFPAAMVFDEDYLLPPGSSVTVKVNPSFSQLRDPGSERQNEYRLTVVLEGFKVTK